MGSPVTFPFRVDEDFRVKLITALNKQNLLDKTNLSINAFILEAVEKKINVVERRWFQRQGEYHE